MSQATSFASMNPAIVACDRRRGRLAHRARADADRLRGGRPRRAGRLRHRLRHHRVMSASSVLSFASLPANAGASYVPEARGRASRHAPAASTAALEGTVQETARKHRRRRRARCARAAPARLTRRHHRRGIPLHADVHVRRSDVSYSDDGEGEADPVDPRLRLEPQRPTGATPGWIDTLTKAGRRVIAIDNRGHGESEKLTIRRSTAHP